MEDDSGAGELQALLALAEADSELRRLRRRLDDLPESRAVETAAARRDELARRRADRSLDLDAAQARAAREEREVVQLRQRREAEQQRMYGGEIANARELQSLRAEIESVARRIDEHETAELEAMEEVERVERDIAALDTEMAGVADETAALTEARDEAASAIIAQIAELEVDRDRRREPLSVDVASRYDAAVERFGPGAVGRLDGERCTACGIGLSYADVNALYDGPDLTTCPNCQRLLVVV